jgi:hypothetical protein
VLVEWENYYYFLLKGEKMKNLLLTLVLIALAAAAQAIVTPQAYFPFENTNGTYGAGSEANPAWTEAISSSAPNYIGSTTAPTWPEITTDGIKGDALYATDSTKSGGTMTINYSNSMQDIFDGATSYTITFWANARTGTLAGSNSYILRVSGAGPAIKWRDDGRFQVLDTGGSWQYSNYADRRAGWNFFAFTRSSTGWSMFHGDETTAVSAGTSAAATLGAAGNCDRFIIAGYTYNGSDPYPKFDLDEVRIYTTTSGDGAALGIADLEAIRQFDLIPEPATMAVMGLGMLLIRRKKA